MNSTTSKNQGDLFDAEVELKGRLERVVVADRTFSGTSIVELDAEGCTFKHCKFAGTALQDCYFTLCTFESCDMGNMSVAGTRFERVNFLGSKLIGVNWEQASSRLGIDIAFHECNLSMGSFRRLPLSRLQLRNCEAIEVNFSDCKLDEANFSGTDLRGAIFSSARMRKADLRTAKNYWIDPRATELKGAQFSIAGALMLAQVFGIKVEDFDAT